ncbi:MAG: glycosyltransferase family 4 protein, partial [Acidobacteria bacterium]|nr:glycosyltransferase family 4 protein [Acidobacteriota bacterium]
RPARILWEQLALPGAVRRARIDVLFNPGFTAPVAAGVPQVTVFHDLQHKRHPEFFRRIDLPFWRLLLWAAARRSERLIAVSEATRDDLVRYYDLCPDRIDVVPHGVDERLFGLAREPEPFLLCVSTLHPHKNLDRLLAAFAELRRARPEMRLVLAGRKGFHAAEVGRRIDELDLGEAVRVTGWIERDELAELFRKAWAFVYPSTFEGFGMPVVEAMAAGVPTACSGIRPLTGIAGDAALRFDPFDTAAMTAALLRLVSDDTERARLVRAGRERARDFSWRRAAEQTLAALRRAVEESA